MRLDRLQQAAREDRGAFDPSTVLALIGLADRLAGRLMYHARCDEHVNHHRDCPFCEDRAAYRAYLAAGGQVRVPEMEGELVSPHDIPYTAGRGPE